MTAPEVARIPESREVHAADGVMLVERTWRPPAGVEATGAMLIVHGVGEHALRYAHVATALAERGILVRGYDQRGFGASGGPRATLTHGAVLLLDARDRYAALVRELADAGDARAPFVFGHSMGGCVVARAVTGGFIAAPRGMILSSPGLVPRIGVVRRAAARLGRLVAPDLRVPHGLPLHKLSHDPGVLPQVTSDRLTHALVTPRLVTFMLDDGERAIADAARCRVPTLLLVAGDDWLVRAEGSRRFHAALPAGVGSLHEYPALYHELLQERPPDRATVLGDLMAWLGGQLASARRGR